MIKQLGIIGLGKMGGNLAMQAKDKGFEVIGKSISENKELKKYGVFVTTDYKTFFSKFKSKKVIYISLPAGELIDKVISEVLPYLSKGDVLMDGGNSFYLDSKKREKELTKIGIHFVDCGTSGGWSGARYGACFMIGARTEAEKIVSPILKKLAVKDGYVHCGLPGSGHFVKLVHNGIEFGMLQAIGEGVELLKKSEFNIDIEKIMLNWNNGSVIRSWLIELMYEGLKEQDYGKIQAYIEDTGEVNWLIQDAINKEIPIPVITTSVFELFKSRNKPNDTYKSIALMRHGFGGHPFGKSAYIKNERKTSRLSKI